MASSSSTNWEELGAAEVATVSAREARRSSGNRAGTSAAAGEDTNDRRQARIRHFQGAVDISSTIANIDPEELGLAEAVRTGVFQLRVPAEGEFAPLGRAGEVCLYRQAFKQGLRLPLPRFFKDLLKFIGIAPGQLGPISWGLAVGFYCYAREAQIEPTVRLFQEMFNMTTDPRGQGWYIISAKRGLKWLAGYPQSVHGWKKEFFFVKGPVGCPFKMWKKGRLNFPKNPGMAPEVVKVAAEIMKEWVADHKSLREMINRNDFERLLYGGDVELPEDHEGR